MPLEVFVGTCVLKSIFFARLFLTITFSTPPSLPITVGFEVQDHVLTGMNCTNCVSCGGQCSSVANWTPVRTHCHWPAHQAPYLTQPSLLTSLCFQATWTKGQMTPLKWQPRQYLPLNEFTTSISLIQLQELIENSIADRLQESLEYTVSCRYGIVWQRIEQIFKFCAVPTKGNSGTAPPPSATPLAYKTLFYNYSDFISVRF